MKILITGANGQVGTALRNVFTSVCPVIALGHRDCDVSNKRAITSALNLYQPTVIINCAAYTAVDSAEENSELASAINAKGPENIGREAKRMGALVIHYSTDYVFDGSKQGFYEESDQPNPKSIYGKTKLAGDVALQNSGAQHIILRTSWVYSQHGNNFLRTILNLGKQKENIDVIYDQTGTPTSAEFIAEITSQLLKHNKVKQIESLLYNLTPSGKTNWYEFSKFIIDRSNKLGLNLKLLSTNINPVTTNQYTRPAPRPFNSLLSIEKIQKDLDKIFPPWEEGVNKVLEKIIRVNN